MQRVVVLRANRLTPTKSGVPDFVNLTGEVRNIGLRAAAAAWKQAGTGDFALILEDKDDWAFSPCLSLEAGKTYSVNYMHRTGVWADQTPILEEFEILHVVLSSSGRA